MSSSDYQQYTVKFNPEDAPTLYSDWGWLISQKYLNKPWLMTSFGDLFFEGPDASIHFLDTLEGTITLFAENEEIAKEKLAETENQRRFLTSDTVDLLIERDLVLKDDELYIYVPHPIVAGEVRIDSVQIMSMNVVISLGGQLLRQIGR